MKRCEFITLLGGAVVALFLSWPFGAHAQQASRMPLVAMVLALAPGDQEGERFVAQFREALQQLGWTPDRNVRLEFRWGASDAERARAYATDVVKLNPNVVVAQSTVVTRALSQHTRTVPIVFANVSDPIGEKFVASFARHGGNVTGFTNVEPSMGGKYLEILKEISPKLSRAALLFNPKSTPGGGLYFSDPFKAAARSLSVQSIAGTADSVADIETVISTLGRSEGSGLVVVGEPFTNLHRARIIALAAQHRLPTICPYRFYVTDGCLSSYGVDIADLFRRAASYVDRILKGELPAELPVQAPIKFEMSINLKTATAFGLAMPPSIHLRADEVIE
jgi:putative ABC transport system substrate-binding protein